MGSLPLALRPFPRPGFLPLPLPTLNELVQCPLPTKRSHLAQVYLGTSLTPIPYLLQDTYLVAVVLFPGRGRCLPSQLYYPKA